MKQCHSPAVSHYTLETTPDMIVYKLLVLKIAF